MSAFPALINLTTYFYTPGNGFSVAGIALQDFFRHQRVARR